MKSQTRAWIIFIVLFCFWGTLPVSPFAYFSEMIRHLGGLLVIHPFMPGPWQAFLIYLLFALLLTTLLLLGRSRNRLYIAGICALTEMIYHLVICIKNSSIYPVSLAIAIGLALALLFLILKSKSPSLWLSDAFTIALPVWLIYDAIIYPLGRLLSIKSSLVAGFIPIPDSSLLTKMDGFLGLPLYVWSVLPLLMAILPVVLFGKNRQKG